MKKYIVLTIFAAMTAVSACTQVFAEDFPSIVKRAKERNKRFINIVKDITIKQETTTNTEKGDMTSEMEVIKKGDKIRTNTTVNINTKKEMPPMTMAYINDGKDAWMISPMMGKQRLNIDQDNNQSQKDWLERISDKATLSGSEKVNGRNCYVLNVENSNIKKMWIDKKNLVLVKEESRNKDGKMFSVSCSNFKKIIEDYEIPYKMEMVLEGKNFGTVTIRSIELNKNVSDDLFDADKAAGKQTGPSVEEMMKMYKKRK
ncbi:MAG: hypothetical protein A2044_05070 [Candidatus Firestonebacteria bacterium GWA2_43_8]|nr:MAG: hypothetical protein A2044_05070 [Candidatus Firestonebacteria bacterium GWA2_43_8]